MDELTASQPSSIRQMFGTIAGKYDLINSVLSVGIHHYWKRKLVNASGVKPGDSILDCATGTGDLAFQFEKRLQGTGRVIGTDFCEPMLQLAKAKATQKNSEAQFQWADVTHLPFADQSFNIASISFGIRNVDNPKQALSELGRVVKSGGRVLVLEFGQPRSRLIAPFYRFYSRRVLPLIGGWISGQRQAYEYLETSSAQFPCDQSFLEIARSTGKFSEINYRRFFSGIAYLYILKR